MAREFIIQYFFLIGIGGVLIISPFAAFMMSFLILFVTPSLFLQRANFFYLIISTFLGLLAYTQVSLAQENLGITTDIERYYYAVLPFINSTFDKALPYILLDILYIGFTFINYLLVSTFNNVQIIALFWTIIIYYLYFKSIHNFCLYKEIKIDTCNYGIILFLSIFSFIIFTQVTEIIKQAACFSVFFYGLSLILLDKKKGYIWMMLSVTIHSSAYLLFIFLVLFKLPSKYLKILVIVSLGLIFFNVMDLAANLLPDIGYLSLIKTKALGYSVDVEGFISSVRYVCLAILIFFLYIYMKIMGGLDNKIEKIILSYLFLLIITYNNPHNFIRQVNMSHFIFMILLIELLKVNVGMSIKKIKERRIVIITYIFALTITTFQMNYGRTFSNGYTSSYMDNSISKIISSNIFDYLNQKTY